MDKPKQMKAGRPKGSLDPKNPKKKRRGKLSHPRHEIFAHKVIQKNGDPIEAIKDMTGEGYFKNKDSMENVANRMMNHPEVQNRIKELMHMIYTPEELYKDIQQMRTATKPIVFEGEITDQHPDYGIRMEMLKLYMKVSSVTDNTPTNQTNMQFNVESMDSEAALKIAKEISALSQSITPDKSGRRN